MAEGCQSGRTYPDILETSQVASRHFTHDRPKTTAVSLYRLDISDYGIIASVMDLCVDILRTPILFYLQAWKLILAF